MKSAVPATPEEAADWHALLHERNIAPSTILMVFSEQVGPALVRTFFGYKLVVPREVWDELPTASRLGILRHELAHYERGDVWKSLFVRLLALPHWFNPLSHLAVRKFDEAAECLCDEAAYEQTVEGRAAFAEMLLTLHESVTHHVILRQAIWGRGLRIRITHLLNTEPRKEISIMKKALILTIVALIFAVGLINVKLTAKTADEKTTATANSAERGVKNDEIKKPNSAEQSLGLFTTDKKQGDGTINPIYQVRGRILLPDGTPAKNVKVSYHSHFGTHSVATDENGVYVTKELLNAQFEKICFFVNAVTPVDADLTWQWAAPKVVLSDLANQPPERFELRLQKGIPLTGTLISETDGKPVAESEISISTKTQVTSPFQGGLHETESGFWLKTDQNGKYDTYLLPGEYEVYPGRACWDSQKIKLFVNSGDTEKTLNLKFPASATIRVVYEDGTPLVGKAPSFCLVTNPGSVVERNGQKVNDGAGYTLGLLTPKTDEKGYARFPLSPYYNQLVYFSHANREGGILIVSDEDSAGKEYTLVVKPFVIGKIRLMSKATGKPIVNMRLRYDFQDTYNMYDIYHPSHGTESITDDQGYAELAELVPGAKYSINVDQYIPMGAEEMLGNYPNPRTPPFIPKKSNEMNDFGDVYLDGNFSEYEK